MSIINVGRGFTHAKYWVEPEIRGRYPQSLAEFNRSQGGFAHPPNVVCERNDTSVSVVCLYGKTREGQSIEFSNVEFLKLKDGEYTFTATVSASEATPLLMRRYTRRDDVYLSGRFTVKFEGDDFTFSDFKDVAFHGVGKKAMNLIRGTTLVGYSLTALRSNIIKNAADSR